MVDGRPLVEDYMTRDVVTVDVDASVAAVRQRIADNEGHNGFPVIGEGCVRGFITARDLLLADGEAPVASAMSDEIIVAHPAMDLTDAARVILRSGIQKLPVVDDAGRLVGIISNSDVIRSQIERATPEKVGKLRATLERIHGVDVREERREVDLDRLAPTQSRVYTDELEGRTYELQQGLAEPLVVVDTTDGLFLADGHHRVLAASRKGIERMDAYVIVLDRPVDLGIARTARESGLEDIEDIEEVDYAHHPLVETTERFRDAAPGR
jgi:IMP dehydrogenase